MVKNSLIDEIVSEWASLCEDGMAGGHYTPENISTLASVLEKRGLSKDEVLEIINPMMDEAAKKGVTRKVKPPEPEQEAPSELDTQIAEKKFNPPKIGEELKNILTKNANSNDFVEFAQLFNSVDGADRDNAMIAASKVYNRLPNTVKDTINNIQTGQKRSALGKGEILFVWIIKGAVHGGTETGDIVVGDFKVDVKDYQESIDIERNSFTNFNSIEFVSDLSELIHILRDPKVQDFVLKLLETYEDELLKYASDPSTGVKKGPGAVKGYTEVFLKSFDMGKLGVYAKCGLNFISKKVEELAAGETTATTVMSVYSKGEKQSAVIDDKDLFTNEPIEKSIQNIGSGGKEIAVNAKPMEDQNQSITLSKLRRANYFRRKDKWTESTMWASMARNLNYDGIILLEQQGNKVKDYVPKGVDGEGFAEKFAFRGIQKGITLSYRGSKEKSEG